VERLLEDGMQRPEDRVLTHTHHTSMSDSHLGLACKSSSEQYDSKIIAKY
jgi:hypothetical protein